MKYIIDLNGFGNLELGYINKSGERETLTTDRKRIEYGLIELCKGSCIICIYSKDLVIKYINKEKTIRIKDYETVVKKYHHIKMIVNDAINRNGYVRFNRRKLNDYNKYCLKRARKEALVRTASIVLSTSLSLGAFSYVGLGIINRWDSEKTKASEIPIEHIISALNKKEEQEDVYEVNNEKIEPVYYHRTMAEPSLESKISFLINYCNMQSESELRSFAHEFVETMNGYGQTFSDDEIIKILYSVSQVPLENKISRVKSIKGLDDKELDEVAGTIVAEGLGSGKHYVPAFAAMTVALNHTQNKRWIDSISNERGVDVGSDLYLHTAYKNQFEAYEGNQYNINYGDRTSTGFKASIDAIYINDMYGLILHNYGEFKTADWAEEHGIEGKSYYPGDNIYHNEFLPAERLEKEIFGQKTK